MAYYGANSDLATSPGIAKCTAAAVNARFKGMNILTTLEALPKTDGFEAYSATPLLGYAWSGTQIYYVVLSTLKRDINNILPWEASASGTTFTNSLAHPRVYYVVFQAAGGKGGYDSANAGTGGGSGYYTISRVVLQPGSSFKVTHHDTYAECKLVTGTAYMDGGYKTAGYSFTITATAGRKGGGGTPGNGFRRGGDEGKYGNEVSANTLAYDGYSFPAYRIYGGATGKIYAQSGLTGSHSAYYSGGGGASAGGFLWNTGSPQTSGGNGAYYYKDTYRTISIKATPGIDGGGGGGSDGLERESAGGPAVSLVYY